MEAILTKTGREQSTSTIVESWNNLVFLVHEPDLHSHLVWNVRLAVGDLPAWRFGPFESKREAVCVMNRLAELVDQAIGDVPAEIVSHAGCGFGQDF